LAAYVSADNLNNAEGLSIKHVACHNRASLTVETMTGGRWLCNNL
jgi:hypothetical protein